MSDIALDATAARRRSPQLARRVAERLGCTEGQAYTAAVGLVLAVVLAVGAVPAALRTKPVPDAAASPPPSRVATRTTPATVGPVPAAGPALAVPTIANGSGSNPTTTTPIAAGAHSTAVVPLGTITTFATVPTPGAPNGLAVRADGSVLVTTGNGTARGAPGPSHLFSYSTSGALVADVAVEGQPDGHADGLTGAAVDPTDGSIVVLDAATGRVLDHDPVGLAVTVRTTLIDLPPCLLALGAPACEPGLLDHKPLPTAAVFDRTGTLYISDPAQATIWRQPRSASQAEAWYQSTDFATGDGPTGLAWDRGGDLEFTVGKSLDRDNPDAGGLYRLTVNADGTPGARALAAKFNLDDEPGAIATGQSGTTYIILRGSGSIVSIGPDGQPTGRIDPPGSGATPIDTPSALALRDGELLVANQSPNTPSRWAVLAITVDDGPMTGLP